MSKAGFHNFLLMLVDDNEADTFINKMTIELAGFTGEFIVHTNGKSAIEYLRRFKDTPTHLPDLIFLDLNMPIMNGFQFLQEFDHLPIAVKTKCRIVILSSSDNEKDMEKALTYSHVVSYCLKPLTQQTLQKIHTSIFDASLGNGH